MNVGLLRKYIANLDESLEVLIRWNDDECCHVGGTMSISVEAGCADSPALMIDADTECDTEDL